MTKPTGCVANVCRRCWQSLTIPQPEVDDRCNTSYSCQMTDAIRIYTAQHRCNVVNNKTTIALMLQAGRLAAHVRVATGNCRAGCSHFVVDCRYSHAFCLQSCPHLISVSEALYNKWRQGIVAVQVRLEPHCNAVKVWAAHSQVLTSRASSHLFSHLPTIALGQSASPALIRHLQHSLLCTALTLSYIGTPSLSWLKTA